MDIFIVATMSNSAEKLPSETSAASNHNAAAVLALICRAAADSLRLQVLRILKAESFGVLELCQILDLAQPKLSHHLKVLATANLVATRREGNSIFYRRPLLDLDAPLTDFTQELFKTLDSEPLSSDVIHRISHIKAERSRLSLDFFAKNAGKFNEMQELITENSEYVVQTKELIDMTGLANTATVIEIGPGEGHYLPTLAQRFAKVVAIDNSAAMLAVAQQQAAAQQLDNIDFILGEPDQAIRNNVQGDLVVCHMVLHHTPSPAVIFEQSAELLRASGYLLVAELCHHNQDWVKGSCGDLWLGFEPEELKDWALKANLTPLQDLFLGLRNGFQIQLHLFQKL
jgi:2-polyprenyl-3-methyl-5-hydroxy-6-metoxy-1,4-benzoquinol methylase